MAQDADSLMTARRVVWGSRNVTLRAFHVRPAPAPAATGGGRRINSLSGLEPPGMWGLPRPSSKLQSSSGCSRQVSSECGKLHSIGPLLDAGALFDWTPVAYQSEGATMRVRKLNASTPTDAFLSLLIPGLVLVHLAVAPYTKVEESFNMQATHDVLVYGTPTADVRAKLGGSYDHFAFPGAVPRTFVGPVILAGVSQPLIALAGGFRHAQLVVRAVLGLFNTLAMLAFKAALGRAYGKSVERWYTLFQASQFHVIFYASRTLPNMFAFGLTTLAFTNLLPSPNPKAMAPRQRVSISLFVLAAIIFRSEVALLLATNALYLVVAPLAPLERLIWPFAISSAMALLVSVPLDSYFWQRPLWPELWGFYYNAVLGSSSNWGVSPWHCRTRRPASSSTSPRP
ncbi:alpha-1,6-mannosyltransferase subunit [Gaeumannomyces tritici R3-111a-1]|uniref:Mannosyltransferase n=1 Tax=Gaeumannomyces tritici (strain R3-111a-1) TaxID=644352 RepID=J3NYI9_GAET3|nr:alpha-1,6-mannosyltransferase subunit [Gaeumannomyces tritici R3-111a-1]EJT76422.1 alpha-1,6-mannosyltransferase subunit [Gaeumannomyces tritici R3-111a-1]